MMKTVALATLLATAALAAPAQAALLKFTITGDYSATFRLDATPVPNEHNVGSAFVISGVAGVFGGSAFTNTWLTFDSFGANGGLSVFDPATDEILFLGKGPQLYSGPESTPSFRVGTFALSSFFGTESYRLTIAAVDAAVPEPATWAMMIGGFALVGSVMRRRKVAVAVG